MADAPLTLRRLLFAVRQGEALAEAVEDSSHALLDHRICDALASFRAATSAPEQQAAESNTFTDCTFGSAALEPEYTREEMREACRNNYHAGAAVGADLAAQVAQLRADVAAMGNALADYFDNGSDYATGAKVRAIAERQGAKNG
jgi:hypothetical protein